MINPEYVTSKSEKKLANKHSEVDHDGFLVLSNGAKSFFNILGWSSAIIAGGGKSTAITALSISSLFSNALSGLSKLIQVIEFTTLMSLFNFKYDPVLSSFLSKLSRMTSLELIPFPLNDWLSDVSNSIASQWKGKASETEMKPYLLQELGYAGLLLQVYSPDKSRF